MKRRDDSKTSLVEFLRSIKFAHQSNAAQRGDCHTHFAHFVPQARGAQGFSSEDCQLIRSAN